MLSSTYSLITLFGEQKNARHMLLRLERTLQSKKWDATHPINCVSNWENVRSCLMQLDQYCQSRSLETLVIPAVRRATRDVDGLFEQLDSLKSACASIRSFLEDQSDVGSNFDILKQNEFRFSVEIYCQNIVKKLDLEEKEFFPIARRLLSNEEWFSIANKILSNHGKNKFRDQVADFAGEKRTQRVNRRRRSGRMPFPLAWFTANENADGSFET